MSESTEDVTELGAALITALSLLCERLIESGNLNREELTADLGLKVESLRLQDTSVIQQMFLSGLAFSLANPVVRNSAASAKRGASDFFNVEIENIEKNGDVVRLLGDENESS